MAEVYHIPALLHETIEGLHIKPDGVYVDVTFGGGGHSLGILQAIEARCTSEAHRGKQLFSFDQDLDALANARLHRQEIVNNPKWQFVHSNFRYLRNFMDYYGIPQIDGLIADLGVSFHHFDEADRGFSFRFSGPLDMRMNQTGGKSAADILNSYSEEALARALYIYGELKNSRQLAHRIVQQRDLTPILRTEQLVSALTRPTANADNLNPQEKKMLTLVFQALRIEVNDELGALREMLMAAKDLLCHGGRIAILTYHSLEDRIVKNFLRSGNLDGEIEKDFYGNIQTPFRLIEKGLTASEEEVERNPRSRSAKLRIAEKI